MSTVRVTRGPRSTLFCGPGGVLVPSFRTLGTRRQWDSRALGWRVPNGEADDVIAFLEQRGGVHVDVEQAVS